MTSDPHKIKATAPTMMNGRARFMRAGLDAGRLPANGAGFLSNCLTSRERRRWAAGLPEILCCFRSRAFGSPRGLNSEDYIFVILTAIGFAKSEQKAFTSRALARGGRDFELMTQSHSGRPRPGIQRKTGMHKKNSSESGVFNPRVFVAFILCLAGVSLAMFSWAGPAPARISGVAAPTVTPTFGNPVIAGIGGSGFEIDIRVDPSNGNRIYMSAPGALSSDTSCIWRSLDAGKTFKWVPNGAPLTGKVTTCHGGGD